MKVSVFLRIMEHHRAQAASGFHHPQSFSNCQLDVELDVELVDHQEGCISTMVPICCPVEPLLYLKCMQLDTKVVCGLFSAEILLVGEVLPKQLPQEMDSVIHSLMLVTVYKQPRQSHNQWLF